MYALLWSQGDLSGACTLLGAEHDALRVHWQALDRPIDGEEAVSLARSTTESMLGLLRYHFHNEEFFMRALKYPDFECHKVDHQRLIRDLREILNGLPEASEKWPQVALLLRNWHLEHARDYDRPFLAHLDEHVSRDGGLSAASR